ncbi:MAG TPA: M20/M25/M40 family metallo-hydrolase [Myxococcales bacterium]|jgi:acetylornithine deacetylase/succinyl-diaminopimelate desuccinylase-like protein
MLSTGFLQLAKKLIAADTVSANGTLGAVEVLQGLYEHAGLPTRRQVVDGIHVNLLAGPGGDAQGPGGVLLVTHLDTVPAAPGWQTDPWTLTEKEGFLFGLGVADVKLDALCKAEAARRLQGRTCQKPFWLLGTFGEEVGLRGARHFVQSAEFAEIRPAQVLCGEPSELQVISAHKGYCVVRCTLTDRKARKVSSAGPGVEVMRFQGKAAHSSTPHLGVNAISKALRYLNSSGAPVLAIRGGTSSNVVPASCSVEVPAPREKGEPQPDEVKFTPARELEPNLWRALATASALEELWQHLLPRDRDTRFDPPGAVGGLNVIDSADGAVSLQLDARLLPSHDPDQLIESFGREAKAWVARLGQGEIELRVETLRNAGGMAPQEGSKLVSSAQKVLRAHGRDATPRAKPTSTEGGIFARAGCEAIVFGPGVSTGNAHSANERIEMAQLDAACDLYEALLVELCACT